MSLKWFHIVFISLSVLLSLWFGVWGLFNQQIVLGIVSLGASAGLVVYGNYFSESCGSSAYEDRRCRTHRRCWRFPGSPWRARCASATPTRRRPKAAQAGILALLVVTVVMLASIAGFFFIYLRRRIRMFEESNGGSF